MNSPTDTNDMGAPTTDSSRIVYQNRWMTVREDAITRPSGDQGIYSYVDKPDFALVIPEQEGDFYLVEQYRYPISRRSLEFPQGTYPDRQPTEDPAHLAALELAQETGLRAGVLQHLGHLFGGPGMTNQGLHVYLATDLSPGHPDLDPEEADLTCVKISRSGLESMIMDGTIVDAMTVAAWHLYVRRVP